MKLFHDSMENIFLRIIIRICILVQVRQTHVLLVYRMSRFNLVGVVFLHATDISVSFIHTPKHIFYLCYLLQLYRHGNVDIFNNFTKLSGSFFMIWGKLFLFIKQDVSLYFIYIMFASYVHFVTPQQHFILIKF